MGSTSPRKVAEHRSQLFLRITHPTLDPDEITRELALEPEHVARAGASVSAKGKQSLNSESYWLATLPTLSLHDQLIALTKSSKGQPGFLPTEDREILRGLIQTPSIDSFHVQAWLRKLEEHRTYLHNIHENQGTITLIVQRSNRKASLTISPSIARKLADLRISLEID